MIHLSFLGERYLPKEPILHQSPEEAIITSSESAASKIRNLDSDRPYPLLHWTTKGRAARIILQGIFSSGYAKDCDLTLNVTDHLQGSYAISVTDLEGFFAEQDITPAPEIAQIAMGINPKAAENPFYHRGGVCFVINPQIEHEYGGESISIPIEKARKILIAKVNGNTIQYGGQSPGEAVVAYRIAPRELEGIILTREFQDGDILTELQKKHERILTAQEIDLYRLFEDEINILTTLCIDTTQIDRSIEYLKDMGTKDRMIMKKLGDLTFEYHGEPDDTVKLGMNLITKTRLTQELINDLHDPELIEHAQAVYSFMQLSLKENLKVYSIRTYTELIVSLAKKKNIPVYDNSGTVVWPT